MQHDDIEALFDHLYWIRDKVLDAAEAPSVQLADPRAPTGRDLRSTLVHELDVEWSWRVRLAGDDPTRFAEDDEELEPGDFPTIASIRERWAADEADMRAWLTTLDDGALAAACDAEDPPRHARWVHLQHLYTHALQQFADAATLLSAAGRSPGSLDFLEWADRERT